MNLAWSTLHELGMVTTETQVMAYGASRLVKKAWNGTVRALWGPQRRFLYYLHADCSDVCQPKAAYFWCRILWEAVVHWRLLLLLPFWSFGEESVY